LKKNIINRKLCFGSAKAIHDKFIINPIKVKSIIDLSGNRENLKKVKITVAK